MTEKQEETRTDYHTVPNPLVFQCEMSRDTGSQSLSPLVFLSSPCNLIIHK